ncbi:MAG: hypothetical protein J0L92_27320 [Deltaproteobacteria bacterium]|nr:hypothetical protein [Deltaproteobacteria bacterium]
MVLATQNPMDLDYRALSNAGTWCLGRLSTNGDRERVLEGLGEHTKKSPLAKMQHRWFVGRDAKGSATCASTRGTRSRTCEVP